MVNATRTDDWSLVQSRLRASYYGPWSLIRSALCARMAERAPEQGIGSSDVNHAAYEWVRAGASLPEIMEGPR